MPYIAVQSAQTIAEKDPTGAHIIAVGILVLLVSLAYMWVVE